MTFRAIKVLKEVDYILCEDTRTSGILLKHYEISKPLKSYHLHNEHTATEKVIADLKSGQNIAIITDAGTPEFQTQVICSEKLVQMKIWK
jgi:16S rRNA (cytidine1402-2'-O)-methyltransferase